jgi:regulator of extracellular matrix RemA (YlzA/DUF370 family)
MLFIFIPALPASPAAATGTKPAPAAKPKPPPVPPASKVTIEEAYPDALHIVAENYAAKVVSADELISCIGPIKTRPDDGLIFVSSDTAIYLGLPSPETQGQANKLAASLNRIIFLRNLNEGFNASRMFDLSKFDVVILNAAEVGSGLTPQDILVELGDKVADFDMHLDLSPNKVILLTSPGGNAVLKKVDAGAGLFKTVITFPDTTLAMAIYWLNDATWAIKAYNPRTNGKIIALRDEVDWPKLMSNENFAKEITADKISSIVMPASAPDAMIKSAAKAAVQRILLYSYSDEEISSAKLTDPTKIMSTSNDITLFKCCFPEMVLFWYQT